MKISNLIALLASLFSLTAHADLKPIAADSPEMTQANVANGIFSVKSVRSGNLTYKLVTLDTPLNGDVSNTSILFTGEEVGGEAGFESAFLVSPQVTNDSTTINSADDIKITPSGVELTTWNVEGERKARTIKYDAKSKVLKEGKMTDAPNCDSMTSTNETYQCTMTEFEKADKTLNTVYAKAMKTIGDKIAQAKLKAAQRAWLAYRNTQCKVEGDENRGGQLERQQIAGCNLRMTNERISSLLELNR